eukprot:scaffold98949_cov32-Tisochrysis_lutea.AAC.2
MLRGDLTPIAHLGHDAEVLVLASTTIGAFCILAAACVAVLKATVVPVQVAMIPALEEYDPSMR